MESIVIGTAGHIDHGKTALVTALTGQNTDTIAEEQQRGITINLGFAYFQLPSGKTAGLVDVPGHERFIRNMVAGASGIDIALVVIAATDGVMPQTKEHIDILSYLGIQQSLVVITKIDLVDPDFKDLMLEDTKDYLSTTFLKDSPLLLVDSLSGTGIPALITQLDHLASKITQPNHQKAPRLNIDRGFSVKGFGTVVTGTLAEGTISLGDELTLYPAAIPTKIRGIQIHEQPTDRSTAGQRTALNLGGITLDQVHRGSVLAQSGSVFVTHHLTVQLSLLPAAPTQKKRSELKLYIGASELIAQLLPLDKPTIKGGDSAYAQLILPQPAVVRRGDPFVLRTITPVETIGGGTVIDPTPPRYKKTSPQLLEHIHRKATGTPQIVLEEFIRTAPFSTKTQLEHLTNLPDSSEPLETLVASGTLLALPGGYLHPETLAEFADQLSQILTGYHQAFPLRGGISKAELQSRQTIAQDPKDFSGLLSYLETTQQIQTKGSLVALWDFTPHYTPELEQLKTQLLAQVAEAGYSPPTAEDLTKNDPQRQQVLESLLGAQFIPLDGQLVLDSTYYTQAKQLAEQLYHRHGAIKLSDFRDATDTSRKYALAILEKLDKDKITLRQGETRLLLHPAPNKQ